MHVHLDKCEKIGGFAAESGEIGQIIKVLIQGTFTSDSERENTYSGEYVIPEFPSRKNVEMRAIRQLDAKEYVDYGCSGSVYTGVTEIRFSVDKEIVEAHVNDEQRARV